MDERVDQENLLRVDVVGSWGTPGVRWNRLVAGDKRWEESRSKGDWVESKVLDRNSSEHRRELREGKGER